MEDIIKRMQSLAINYNKNLKFAKSYIKDINKEDRQQLAKAKAKAKVEEKKVENAVLADRYKWRYMGPL